MTALAVALGAAVGAPLRYLVDRGARRPGSLFPWGTFLVNLVGSFVLGILTGMRVTAAPTWAALLGTGLCGALTTYSTFSIQTVALLEDGKWGLAMWNVGVTLACGLSAATLGMALYPA